MAQVGIILGSDSDLPKVQNCFKILDEFNIEFEIIISSAHRTPEQTKEWTKSARGRGIKVIIAVAGGAAHLPGVVSAYTTLPVIGVPIESNIAGGIDSILSILQMPSGISVATMPVGKAGGSNAALFALNILSVTDESIIKKLDDYRKNMGVKISAKNKDLTSLGYEKYINKIQGK